MRVLLFTLLCFLVSLAHSEEEVPLDIQVGEKLFREDRFSQSYFDKSSGDVNQVLEVGDSVLETLDTPLGPMPNPHRGKQVSCASCHFVDQTTAIDSALVFTYNDWAVRTKIPLRDDGETHTLRNSMNLVISSLEDGQPLHWDGEFYTAKDLSCASLVGRNMGWKNAEAQQARQHIVNVIRKDVGSYPNESDLAESYKQSFKKLGVDVQTLSDEQVMDRTCELMAKYLKDLDFARDDQGDFIGSAYDQFLKVNGLRRGLKIGETLRDYLQYLKNQLNFKKDWIWVKPQPLQFHNHAAQFGPKELKGMQTFFLRGQCASCHMPPEFTDRLFHNIGISQFEYDQLHGTGAFAQLPVPQWSERDRLRSQFFSATEKHLQWAGPFAKTPSAENTQHVDLGAWNVLGHPDKKLVQKSLRDSLCASARMPSCDQWTDDDYLKTSFAAFKTPSLRSLGQSAPYFHNGSSSDLKHVLQIYMFSSAMAQRDRLRNGDPMLKAVRIGGPDFEPLEAFLKSLDEDYD